jgi:pantothenate kinase type III
LDLLALDIGNGSIKWGRFVGGRRVDGGRLALDADPDALRAHGSDESVFAAVSVNPPVARRWQEAHPTLRVMGDQLPLPLPVRYRPPADCGDDRVAAAAGALHKLPDAQAVLVLDVGTCLVATVATRSQGVAGGAILPGRDLMARILADGTAALPHVVPEEPRRSIGDSTAGSIQAGIDAAVVGAARELIARISGEFAGGATVVATGTGGGALASRVGEIRAYHPYLTLWGVYAAAIDDNPMI